MKALTRALPGCVATSTAARRTMASTPAAPSITVHSIPALYTMNPRYDAENKDLGLISNAAVSFKDGQIVYVGSSDGAPEGEMMINGEGTVGLPGLVDCHTHTVYAGTRSEEFGRRLAGATYMEILESGGGIHSTVQATREASLEDLTRTARSRIERMVKQGVTTVEVKSGYGLTARDELKMLQAARACGDTARIFTTYLGAHTLPKEYADDRDGYVQDIIENHLPLVKDYADAVDVFVDRGAFTLEEGKRVLAAGKALGLGVKAHAEQVVFTGIAEAAAELGALSVDHLERLDEHGVRAMKAAGTVAVLNPGAQLYLKDTSPPIDLLRKFGVPIAVATDLNPGSSPVHDLWLCATLGCIVQGLTMKEALKGITVHAGKALGRTDLGIIADNGGSVADLVLYRPPVGEPPIYQSLLQHMAGHDTTLVVRDGEVAYLR